MKLFTITILALGLLASCGEKETKNTENNTPTTSTETSTGSESEKKINTIELTKADFLTKIVNYESNSKEWKYLGDKPAILDFYATWCAPCKAIAPVLEELAEQYKDQIYIYKIDTDKESELSTAFGIRSIPTLFFIPMSGDPQITQGALAKAQLIQAIDSILLKK